MVWKIADCVLGRKVRNTVRVVKDLNSSNEEELIQVGFK